MAGARLTPLLLAAVVVTACDSTDGRESAPAPTGTAPAASSAASRECAPVENGNVSRDAILRPGPSNGLSASPATGEPLVIDGVVLDIDCEAAPGATVRVWHTDARGRYGPGEDRCCYYAGTVSTDEIGRFRLQTIRPGRYAGTNPPPAHIHLEVRHASGDLNTEIVFAGEEGVPTVPVDGYAPVELERSGGDRPSWHGAVTLTLSD